MMMINASEVMPSNQTNPVDWLPSSMTETTIGLGALTQHQFQTQLNLALQRTLDLETQIRVFFQSLASRHGIESLTYRLDEEGLAFEHGNNKHHSCEFKLVTENEEIGELVMTRRIRLSEEDIRVLELSTISLVYPLRNALKFRQALKSATTDPLTGTGNRGALEEAARQEFENLRRHNRPFSIALIDLDRFKQINDQYGHSAGDTVLKAIARHIQNNSRATDRLFRYGGEEFVLVMGTTNNDGAMINAERLRAMIAGLSCVHEDKDIPVTMSIGVASAHTEDNLAQLLERADEALYIAKAAGRNRVINEKAWQ
jgi:diguanylate cyclase (GGDEF)-like protein